MNRWHHTAFWVLETGLMLWFLSMPTVAEAQFAAGFVFAHVIQLAILAGRSFMVDADREDDCDMFSERITITADYRLPLSPWRHLLRAVGSWLIRLSHDDSAIKGKIIKPKIVNQKEVN